MFFLSLEDKRHAFFYKEKISAATVTVELRLFVLHTIVNVIIQPLEFIIYCEGDVDAVGCNRKNSLTSFLNNCP